jgi:hypothetical protein
MDYHEQDNDQVLKRIIAQFYSQLGYFLFQSLSHDSSLQYVTWSYCKPTHDKLLAQTYRIREPPGFRCKWRFA